MTERPMVEARDVRRRYGTREVLRGVDVTIARGSFVALLGRSGSGKSTFLRALAGLDRGATGAIRVPRRRAVVFQDPRLLPWADVRTNVGLGLPRSTARQAAQQAIAEVGLAGREHDWPKTLSGGEAHRVALARALVREPQFLLLDEPFAALDALTRTQMHALVKVLHARHRPATLLVTHDIDECTALADRALVLDGGRISLDVEVGVQGGERSAASMASVRRMLLEALGADEPFASIASSA
jgi:sulfonate transport system ATP-binding protein